MLHGLVQLSALPGAQLRSRLVSEEDVFLHILFGVADRAEAITVECDAGTLTVQPGQYLGVNFVLHFGRGMDQLPPEVLERFRSVLAEGG